MRNETIAIHAGYEPDPATKSVAVPIYQTVAYAFDSADHGAALFNLEAEGYRYSRIANPTTAVLEQRLPNSKAASARSPSPPARRRCISLSSISPMSAATSSPFRNFYGTTHTLLAHILPRQGITTRFADSDRPDAIEKLIDRGHQGGVLRDHRQSRRQRLRHRGAWPASRTAMACRSSSTTPSPLRSCSGRSTTAPISPSIR